MRRRYRFRPVVRELESRVVLTHGHARSAFSVLTGNLQPGAHAIRQGHTASIVALINNTFDLFTQDYTQARSVYFGAVAKRTATAADTVAFSNYAAQRVQVLAQQLTNGLLQSGSSTLRTLHTPSPVTVIGRKINGPNPAISAANMTPFQNSTLGYALISSTPVPGSSSTTISLDSLAQDNAIEAARNAMLNAVVIIKNGDFGNKVAH